MQTDVGPARRTLAQWQSVVARAARSDLSIAEFCRREGVSTASFYAWRKRLGGAVAPLPPAEAPTGGAGFVDLGALELGHGGDRGGAVGSGWEIELDLGAGAVLRLRRR
jgi:putative transposase